MKRLFSLLVATMMILMTLNLPVFAEDDPVTIVYYNDALTTEGSNPDVVARVQQLILDETGVLVKAIVPNGNEDLKLTSLLAANEQIDLFVGDMNLFKSMGAIIPLNDLIDNYGQNLLKAWPENAWTSLTDSEGNIWATPRLVSSTPYPTMIRGDWLEALGLEAPADIDEFEAILEAFAEMEPTVRGDIIPLMTDYDGLRYGLLGAFTEYGNSNWYDEESDEIRPVEINPAYKDFLEKVYDWYQKGYIYKEAFTADVNSRTTLVKENRVGAGIIWYSRFFSVLAALQNEVPEAEYIITPFTGDMGKTESLNVVAGTGYVITKSCKNPEAVMTFLNWGFGSYDNYLTSRYGIKDEHWSYVRNDEEMVVVNVNTSCGYNGEFVTQGYSSSPSQPQLGSSDPAKKSMYDYIGTYYYDYDRVKYPFDFGVTYNTGELTERVETYGDISRMMKEESIKFMTGARPIDEYDAFIEELYSMGLQNYIDELTRQYYLAK